MTQIDTSTEAVEGLLENVTPGPWSEHDAGKHPYVFVCGPDELYYNGEVTDKPLVAYVTGVGAIQNRAFIAAARALVPALLKERDDLRAQIAEVQAEKEKLGREVNTARYGQPDFSWQLHKEALAEAKARAAAAFEMAADVCESILTKIANGPMPEGARFDYEQAIRALAADQERDALAKVRAEAIREAAGYCADKAARRLILSRADEIEKGEL